jgi:glycosyltransferase involved in cell wall biosynthesis
MQRNGCRTNLCCLPGLIRLSEKLVGVNLKNRSLKVVLCVNSAWNVVNFRSGLIRGLQEKGFEVVALAPPDDSVSRLKQLCRYIPLNMNKQGLRPDHDLALFLRFLWVFLKERPDYFLGFTVKPNVYGSLAAHMLGIPVVNNVAGLGAVFIKGGLIEILVATLYKLAFRSSSVVFFQNPDDQSLFVSRRLVLHERTSVLPGSGVDLNYFSGQPCSSVLGKKTRFLLIARMLWDKGVGEYVEAARQLLSERSDVEFHLLGFVGVENPSSISKSQMSEWVSQGLVRYFEPVDDVRPYIADADCIVLPSYREGTPRTLLEAAAMSRPIVTTDAVGCREVVDDGINGFLCEVGSSQSLANAMRMFMNLDADDRRCMGEKGREKVVRQFDERFVIEKYIHALNSRPSARC